MLNYKLFDNADGDLDHIVFYHYEKAERDIVASTQFFNMWISFECWMTCVSAKDTHKQMIEIVADDPRLRTSFDALYDGTSESRQEIDAFAALWPIYDSRKLRTACTKHSVHAFASRDELHHCAHSWGVAHAPQGWSAKNHPNWSDLIKATYRVRCNLFHGQKAVDVGDDAEIMRLAYSALRGFITRSRCYYFGTNIRD